jgi:3-hydroxyacyl-CoA dehydrogenase
MNRVVDLQVQNGVATVTINNPPVNALSAGVVEGLSFAIRSAESEPAVDAIVVLGAGRTFIAGADIKQLEEMAWGRGPGAPSLHDLLLQIEDCRKPVVMAIHRTALGGGLEVAMAGHYRVALASSQLGQPEVNLGIIPGAEGTQRLPRLVGIEKAIEMCVTGKPLTAENAKMVGLVDAVLAGDLTILATEYARQTAARAASLPKTRERRAELHRAHTLQEALTEGRELAGKVKKRLLAPLKVVEAIAAAAELPFENGCRREQELFRECVMSEQCRALIHAFFAERGAAKVRGMASEPPVSFEGIAIVGAGTMGGGIAMACANAGIPVFLKDNDQRALDRCLAMIHKNYEVSVKKGRFSQEAVAERMGRIRTQLDYRGFEEVDLVIEAVFENIELKKKVLSEVQAVVRPEAILASNTSTLNIDELASATHRAEKVVGLHFFSPANVMRLVEIVRGTRSSAGTVSTALALAKRLSKVGVVVGDGPGFVGNRMMFPYMYEAQFVVEEGATPDQVDRALTRFGMAMGIFEVDDMAGLDVAQRVRQELGQFSDAQQRRPLVADKLCAMGRFGQKTGKGWYAYGDGRTAIPDDEVFSLIREEANRAGIPQRMFTDEEIVERTLYGMINEGARILEEGLVERASAIDVIYLNGYGFPAWRGGPMFYADTVGINKILERVIRFHGEHGDRWQPAALLVRLAETGKTFSEHDAESAV